MKHVLRTVSIRKLDRDHRDAERPQQDCQSFETGGSGAEAATDKQRVMIQPYHVAGVRCRFAVDNAKNRNIPGFERGPNSGPLAMAPELSHLKQDRAAD